MFSNIYLLNISANKLFWTFKYIFPKKYDLSQF